MAEGTPLGRLVLRIALLFVPCIALWHFMAPWADAAVATGARLIVDVVLPGVVRQTEIGAQALTFVTAITAPGGAGVLTVDVNPRLYSYGIALYAAIVLGASVFSLVFRGLGGENLVHDALASMPGGVFAAVLAVTVWGAAFDFLAHLVREVPGALDSHGAGTIARTVIALGYQMGSLMFPTVIPAALAVAIARKQLLPTAVVRAN